MSRIYIKTKKIILKKILTLLFLFSLHTYSQEIINEAELTTFLNTNTSGTEIRMEKEFMHVKYNTHLFSDLFSNKVNAIEKLHSFDLSKIIYYRTKENSDKIYLEFIFRNKEEIKKTGFKIFTLSYKKEEKINVAKVITTLKAYQRK
jgi:hypothetical protein